MTSRAVGGGAPALRLRPGWAIVGFYSLFPLWWLLGLGAIGGLAVGGLCALWLVRARGLRLPSGAWVWALFLGWIVLGALLLWVQVPGTLPATGLERVVPWAYRFAWYLAVTAVFVYVINHDRDDLPDVRIHRALASLFLTTVAGGYVGALFPLLSFPSLLEVALPRSLLRIEFLQTLIHPTIAQAQDIGIAVYRPAAPYLYANDWGSYFGLLAPFFVLAWTGSLAGWRRRWFPVLALLSFPPVIFTLNRGLWLGLIVVAIYLAVRLALAGRVLVLGALLCGLVVGGVVVTATPLATLVTSRLENQHSNEGREELAVRSVEAAWEQSPVVGFGATRAVSGNFYSIAGGRSAECPLCAPPNLGTQGTLWSLLFSHGFGGAALFASFLALRAREVMRERTRDATGLGAVVIYFVAVMPVYDLDTGQMMVLALTLALGWRAAQQRNGASQQMTPRTSETAAPAREVAA